MGKRPLRVLSTSTPTAAAPTPTRRTASQTQGGGAKAAWPGALAKNSRHQAFIVSAARLCPPGSSQAALMLVFKHHAENLSLPRARLTPACTHMHTHPYTHTCSSKKPVGVTPEQPPPLPSHPEHLGWCAGAVITQPHTGQLRRTETSSLPVWRPGVRDQGASRACSL